MQGTARGKRKKVWSGRLQRQRLQLHRQRPPNHKTPMETRAVTKMVRVAPRKVRLVGDQIRGCKVEDIVDAVAITAVQSQARKS